MSPTPPRKDIPKGGPGWSLSIPVLLCGPHLTNQAPARELFSLPWPPPRPATPWLRWLDSQHFL